MDFQAVAGAGEPGDVPLRSATVQVAGALPVFFTVRVRVPCPPDSTLPLMGPPLTVSCPAFSVKSRHTTLSAGIFTASVPDLYEGMAAVKVCLPVPGTKGS